jgi:DnaJ-class molecular chaperone
MELQRANEVLKAFSDAVSTVNAEISRQSYKIKRLEGFEEKYKELEKEVQRLKGVERIYNMVKNFTTVEVCPQCDGRGGFVHDMGEAGCEGEECTNCGASGLIDRVVA